MQLSIFLAATLGLGISIATAVQPNKQYTQIKNGVKYNVFEHGASDAKIEYVKNSGICEKTPGVNQYSGYLSVGDNANMWFWFFEARNNPEGAPLAIWLNGGPGCSSMIGLFQENGPCHFVDGASEPTNNTYSWNNYANMLYVDQPIGTGFSYGLVETNSTFNAAPAVWTLFQAFFAQFPQYENRDFGIFTESFGGHYGPIFSSYFQSQNAAIKAGHIQGEVINLVALGINNGWFDPKIQYEAYVDYSHRNPYKQILNSTQAAGYRATYDKQCLPAINNCTGNTGDDNDCAGAYNVCYQLIEEPIYKRHNFDPYDVREPRKDPFPPRTYASYLTQPSVVKAIGAQHDYQDCFYLVNLDFKETGDDSRSMLDILGQVINTGIRTMIWAGDADWTCNWLGNFKAVNAIPWSKQKAFADTQLHHYTVGGECKGLYKTLDNLSWLKVYAAGHEVPYYQPELALQVFKQTMMKQPLKPT